MASSKSVGNANVRLEDGWAGSNPVNPYTTGDTKQLGQFVDTSINYGALEGGGLPVRPPVNP